VLRLQGFYEDAVGIYNDIFAMRKRLDRQRHKQQQQQQASLAGEGEAASKTVWSEATLGACDLTNLTVGCSPFG
jgi:hypothetical protein